MMTGMEKQLSWIPLRRKSQWLNMVFLSFGGHRGLRVGQLVKVLTLGVWVVRLWSFLKQPRVSRWSLLGYNNRPFLKSVSIYLIDLACTILRVVPEEFHCESWSDTCYFLSVLVLVNVHICTAYSVAEIRGGSRDLRVRYVPCVKKMLLSPWTPRSTNFILECEEAYYTCCLVYTYCLAKYKRWRVASYGNIASQWGWGVGWGVLLGSLSVKLM